MSLLNTLTSNPQQALQLLGVLSQTPVQAVAAITGALSGLGVLDQNIAKAVAEVAAVHANGKPLSLTSLLRSPTVNNMLAAELGLPPIEGGQVEGVDIQTRILSNIPGSFAAFQDISTLTMATEENVKQIAAAVEILGLLDAESVLRFVKLLATRGVNMDQTLLEFVNSRQLLLFLGSSETQEEDQGVVIRCPHCDELNHFDSTPLESMVKCGHCEELIFLGE